MSPRDDLADLHAQMHNHNQLLDNIIKRQNQQLLQLHQQIKQLTTKIATTDKKLTLLAQQTDSNDNMGGALMLLVLRSANHKQLSLITHRRPHYFITCRSHFASRAWLRDSHGNSKTRNYWQYPTKLWGSDRY